MWRAEDRDILVSKKIIPDHASRLLLKLTLWSNIHWYRKRNFQPKETDKSRIHGAERSQKSSLLLFTEKGALRILRPAKLIMQVDYLINNIDPNHENFETAVTGTISCCLFYLLVNQRLWNVYVWLRLPLFIHSASYSVISFSILNRTCAL